MIGANNLGTLTGGRCLKKTYTRGGHMYPGQTLNHRMEVAE